MNPAFRWQGNHFYDNATNAVLASCDGTVLAVGSQRLLLTAPATVGAWRLSASTEVQQWLAELKSMTVSRLVVTTPTGTYQLKRQSAFSKTRSIIDAKHRVLGTTRPRINTNLEVALTAEAKIPLVDLVFMTYALTRIDTANRQVKI